ncbi:transient receptor potential cation channel subfamily V member 5-like isoform X3 [Mytilus californianus]|uniref:transient receptor potential cation channel subfamily V member 5-like isoform X3 n=1 Tax=Mytilus californianus TaxID=6549 RepID=UPI0022476366|nr:transient receptor potential cation channel subfamily V member 5-like isoform X3 [Mytilus californianus]
MGNTTVVASGVKQQADAGAKELYNLVDLKGGGELVELMKRARWTKNFKEIDDKIAEVKNFLYDEGRGKKIPIVDLVMMRSQERDSRKPKIGKDKRLKERDLALIDMNFPDAEANYFRNKPADTNLPDRKYRVECWDINQRGTVGENILHMCVLLSTAIHADLAKRLIKAYPKLLNDIYLKDEYYGESALHFAIVNEDPAMVKFLLDHGADYHQRATGNFFTPDDQKESRTDSLEHEWVDLCEKTDYVGHVYYGEYPLSFAASLGQEECVRLLLAKGANPNLQDTNGNTVMHMLVIHDKKSSGAPLTEMFDLLLNMGGKLDIKNRQGLTPLTLSAKLPRKEMYEHILEKVRAVMWIYGNVTCAGYPLKYIDTISETGEINKDSVLSLVVYGEQENHLSMMDGLVVNLLKEKWVTFARFRFYRRFLAFITYFIIFLVAFALRPGEDKCPGTVQTFNLTGNGMINTTNAPADPCFLLKACDTNDKVRWALEIIVLLASIMYLCLAMKEIYHQGFTIFFTTLGGAPMKMLFLLSCVFVVMMLPGRATCSTQYEDVVAVLAILGTAPYFLFFCRGFKILGPFVVMIYKMVKGDLLRFFIIYVVFIIGFSQSMYIVFRNYEENKENPFKDPAESIMGMFMMSLGEFGDYYENFEKTEHPILSKIMFAIYMILVTLLLVNMLIAMMGNTYQLINETQKEWFRQWAKVVLVIEQSVTTEERKKQRLKYSQPLPDGDRALVIRWHQSEKEREDLKIAREEQRIKQKQKIMAERKKLILKKTTNLASIISSTAAREGKINV